MRLYEAPTNTLVRLLENAYVPPGATPVCKGAVVKFHHLDGMYSSCTANDGQVVHVSAWQQVEVVV